MAKSFGDAFVVDVATKTIRLLTPAPSAGFLRVQYLPNGDYFLIGARTFTDIRTTRDRDQEMWLLRASGGPPIALGHKISEGVAISRKSNRIAWSNTHGQYPATRSPRASRCSTWPTSSRRGGQPKLTNKVELLRAKRPECTLEAQDFRFDDTELIYTCYRSPYADVFGLNLKTKAITTFRKIADEYNEVEGIFPDGKHTLVESSKDQSAQDSNHIDIWKLPLVPNATEYVRMTHWGEYDGLQGVEPGGQPGRQDDRLPVGAQQGSGRRRLRHLPAGREVTAAVRAPAGVTDDRLAGAAPGAPPARTSARHRGGAAKNRARRRRPRHDRSRCAAPDRATSRTDRPDRRSAAGGRSRCASSRNLTAPSSGPPRLRARRPPGSCRPPRSRPAA